MTAPHDLSPARSDRPAPGQPPTEHSNGHPVILVVNSVDLLRDCLTAMLARTLSGATVFGIPACETLPETSDIAPDIILVHIGSGSPGDPPARGHLACLRLRFPAVPLIIMGDVPTRTQAHAAIAAGARGYFADVLPFALLVAAVRLVLAGGIFIPTELLGEWIGTTAR